MFDLERFRAGDPSFFRALVEQHGPLVMAIVYRYATDSDHADDLHQEVWTHVFRKRASFEGRGPFGAWLNRVAHRVCIGDHRSRQARAAGRQRYEGEQKMKPHGWEPVDALAQTEEGEFRAALRAALAELPEKQRQSFYLTRVEGRTSEVAGQMLGVSAATVRSNVRHAIHKLRELMEDPGSELSRYRSAH